MQISNSNYSSFYSSFYSSYTKATNQDSKLTQDFRLTNDKLTNTESEKIQISASESLQTETLSDEEMFNKIWENINFFT